MCHVKEWYEQLGMCKPLKRNGVVGWVRTKIGFYAMAGTSRNYCNITTE
jgi:hypothetical protein